MSDESKLPERLLYDATPRPDLEEPLLYTHEQVKQLTAAAYEAAAEKCDVVTQDHIGDIVRGIGDEIRALTPDDARAALERVREEARREEREACALRMEEWGRQHDMAMQGIYAAAAIRARGETP